jgi:hypothetical protein
MFAQGERAFVRLPRILVIDCLGAIAARSYEALKSIDYAETA